MSELHPTTPPPRPDPRERLILALDFPSASASLALLDTLHEQCQQPPCWVKVGLELFLAEGAPFVNTLRTRGYSVFLDLKLHDIPNTVAAAIRALAPLEVNLLTVHASGGPAMLAAAAEAAAAIRTHRPRLLAVTVLTSIDAQQLAAIGIPGSLEEQVQRLAREAWQCDIHGLVASPVEAALLRRDLGSGLHLVTPGIRSSTSPPDDQQRTATLAEALRSGASQLVIGRPITRAANPAAAYDAILSDIGEALARFPKGIP
jgi:orotidine-5'-phosphate decarboxylase